MNEYWIMRYPLSGRRSEQEFWDSIEGTEEDARREVAKLRAGKNNEYWYFHKLINTSANKSLSVEPAASHMNEKLAALTSIIVKVPRSHKNKR
jgi:hypothetical protein